MRTTIAILALLLSFGVINAQKVKMKKGKVYVDKKEYLTYEKNDFFSLDGIKLFTINKEEIEKENLVIKDLRDTSIQSDIADKINRTSDSDNLGRRDNTPKKKKTKFLLVTFNRFKLEFETTLSKSKIIKEFYNGKVVNIAGVIDQVKAKVVANRLNKNITGTRIKVD